MPTFTKMSIAQAQARSATGKRAALLQEYMAYVQDVAPGEAGSLEAMEGETTQAIRRRLNADAEALGQDSGDETERQHRLLLGIDAGAGPVRTPRSNCFRASGARR